jgi:hypothetical protein
MNSTKSATRITVSWRLGAWLPCLSLFLALAAMVVLWSSQAYYWDPDANPANNNCGTGAGMGGTGTWGTTAIWEDAGAGGSWCTAAAKAWSSGQGAYFWGTAGTVTLSAGRTAGEVVFKNSDNQASVMKGNYFSRGLASSHVPVKVPHS